MTEPKEPWECPVCTCPHYEKVTESNGIRGPGYAEWVLYYSCGVCGVLFQSPRLFNKPAIEAYKKANQDAV